jgi:deazaflavin-dependent oxidoreductase (nitroreductase family)
MKRLALVPAAGDLRHFAARAAGGMLAATVKKMSAMTSTQTSNQAAARRIAAFLKPQDFSARTAYRPPAAYYRRINTPLGVLLTSIGLAPRDAVTLEVRGRTSGKLRRTPVLRTRCQGDDYLVSLAGESQWVRNVRAADGRAVIRRRKAHPVHLVEVPAEERPEVISAYLRRGVERSGSRSAAKQARSYFGMNPDPTPEEIQPTAWYYPVFRIVHDAG